MIASKRRRKLIGIVVLMFWSVLLVSVANSTSAGPADTSPQDPFPSPPNDLTRVYYLAESKLVPLPFEEGITSLDVFRPAQKNKVAQVRLRGATAATVLTNKDLSFYVFVADKMEPAPHQLVRLTRKGSGRELNVSVVKGLKGYAPFEEDSVRLEHRLLKRLRVETSRNRYLFVNYMLIRPLNPLKPGEYAIIGDSLSDMATFRIQ